MELTLDQALQKAVEAHKAGKLEEAERLYTAILQTQPKHPDANHNMGVLAAGVVKFQDSLSFFKTALEANPSIGQHWLSYIGALINLNQIGDAKAVFEQAKKYGMEGGKFDQLEKRFSESSVHSQDPPAEELQSIVNLYSQGKLKQSLFESKKMLESFPNSLALYNIAGSSQLGLMQFDAAIISFKQTLEIKPAYAEAYYNIGLALMKKGSPEGAIESYKQALKIKPDFAEAYSDMGNALTNKGDREAAIDSYKQALKINPDYFGAYINLGTAFNNEGNHEAAIDSYKQALKINPDHAETHNNMGNTLQEQKKLEDAIQAYNKALSINPNYAEAYYNMGCILNDQGKLEEAIEAHNKALSLKPYYVEAYNNIGNALKNQGKLEKAIQVYTKALAIKPDHAEALSQAYYIAALMSDWAYIATIENQFENCSANYGLLALADNPSMHLEKSTVLATNKYNHKSQCKLQTFQKSERIKIGYFSSYFRRHPVSILSVQMLEHVNKKQFETYAFHYGPDNNDDYNLRMREAFDHFINVSKMSDKDIAELASKKGIDIAIELNGFMKDGRVGILAHRPAPIQINYLAYPGTMGANFYDYIVADETIIPEKQKHNYSENIIYLPNCYMPQDNTQQISEKQTSRIDCNLPEVGFIFCCFNNSFKISPREFDIWMRLLSQTDGSVLWLLKTNIWAERNLRNQAINRGVDPDRLVFADTLPLSEYLGRLSLADLYLDTFNFNAHTTASQALWVGLPIITKMGKGFAARVTGSLLTSIQIPELITTSEEEYESLALSLATNPEKLAKIKKKLAGNRNSAPLFDTQTYTKNLEKAYTQAYQRYANGLPPAEFKVS